MREHLKNTTNTTAHTVWKKACMKISHTLHHHPQPLATGEVVTASYSCQFITLQSPTIIFQLFRTILTTTSTGRQTLLCIWMEGNDQDQNSLMYHFLLQNTALVIQFSNFWETWNAKEWTGLVCLFLSNQTRNRCSVVMYLNWLCAAF